MTHPRRVPFNQPFLVGRELDYIREAVANAHLAGDGPFSRRCEDRLRELTHSRHAVMTQSCTAALELAGLLLDLRRGDEIILPSFTFVSTANAFVLRGACPVFVDVRPDTLNLDESLVEQAITGRTRAIVAVHYAGVVCGMRGLLDVAKRHGLAVLEDAAHALGSTYDDRPAGSFGMMSALSFHETKNIISGEGGALLLNDSALVARAEVLRDKGTNRGQFFRGHVDKYTWVDVGSSFLPSEITCAFLWAQLEAMTVINARRHAIWSRYHERLAPLEADGLVRRPVVPEDCRHNAHMYYLLLPSLETRTRLIEQLARNGISAVFHYVPLHASPAGRRFGRAHGCLPHTESAADRLVRLPLWVDMPLDDADLVVDAVERILRS